MKNRCLNRKTPDFIHYGGRGITICDKWINSFEDFFEDVGPRPAGFTLERIENSKGYEPGNVRWASRQEQAANRRGNVYIDWRGETLTLSAAARRVGLAPRSFAERVQRGWPIDRAMTTPARKHRGRPAHNRTASLSP